MDSTPLLSLIIPTCNRPDDLRQCLECLIGQIPGMDWLEIHVCDDGRDPAGRHMVEKEFPTVHWHAGPRKGPAANRNVGARAAKGEWLLFIDDDTLPRKGLLSCYLAAMSDPANRDKVLNGPTFRVGERPSLLWEAPHNPDGLHLISCNFALRREIFWEVGGFDERFPMAVFEDTEFAARLELSDVELQFLPAAAVDHPLRPSPSAAKRGRRWEARVISTYDFGATTRQLLARLPRHVALVILSRFRGRRLTGDNLRAIPRFVLEFLFFLWLLPGWIMKYHGAPRSPFWVKQQLLGKTPPRFGL